MHYLGRHDPPASANDLAGDDPTADRAVQLASLPAGTTPCPHCDSAVRTVTLCTMCSHQPDRPARGRQPDRCPNCLQPTVVTVTTCELGCLHDLSEQLPPHVWNPARNGS